MISDVLRDILAKITVLPGLTNTAGIALGGRGSDPSMKKIALPAAWVMYGKDSTDEAPFGHTGYQPGSVPEEGALLLIDIVILLYVAYDTQDDMLDVQYPFLESVIDAINGSEAPNGMRWRYVSQKLAIVLPDRQAYEQHYSLTVFV
jgi:hypothetical protein